MIKTESGFVAEEEASMMSRTLKSTIIEIGAASGNGGVGGGGGLGANILITALNRTNSNSSCNSDSDYNSINSASESASCSPSPLIGKTSLVKHLPLGSFLFYFELLTSILLFILVNGLGLGLGLLVDLKVLTS